MKNKGPRETTDTCKECFMNEIKKLENIINTCVDNIILKSKLEDWQSNQLVKENIRIEYTSSRALFYVYIKDEYNYNIDHNIKYSDLSWWSLRNRRMKRKHKKITQFLENKKKYENLSEALKCLPIKEVRKQKLLKLK